VFQFLVRDHRLVVLQLGGDLHDLLIGWLFHFELRHSIDEMVGRRARNGNRSEILAVCIVGRQDPARSLDGCLTTRFHSNGFKATGIGVK
jgi:hypothetical protein